LGIGTVYYMNKPALDVTPNYITKSTAKGQKANIALKDGSIVRLNAESSITFPESFSADKREVILKGEAFFEVKEDKNRPFLVSAYDVQTTVLGTSFNIQAYDAASVSVALVTGSVKVNASTGDSTLKEATVVLSPGEQAVYDNASSTINIDIFDEKKWTAWKDGIIYFADADYRQVFERLARWYGVEFQFADAPTETWEYSGEFHDMSLELLLNTIGYSKGFDFQIQGKVVNVTFEN